MPHSVNLIHTIAAALGLALALGFVAARLRLPALVGYLLAGVVIGPYTPGFVADAAMASQLAEIGVMLLMFGVGLHFSLGDLLAVRSSGAYGFTMASNYNTRPRAVEVMIDGSAVHVIRERETLDDLMRGENVLPS